MKIDFLDEINRIVSEKFPELIISKPDKIRFPNGKKWHYFQAKKEKGFREWWCCWSITRNANNKYISWIYEWKGKRGCVTKVVEHRRKKDAKERARKIFSQRVKQFEKNNANI